MTGIYLHIIAGLAWEIATSPMVKRGRFAVQPRIGAQKCQYLRNYLRYSLDILTGYGGHVYASVYQRATKSIHGWCCNWPWCTYTFPLTQTSFFTTSYLHIYLSLYISAGIAQLVEQQTFMQQVLGSIPAPDSSWLGVDSALHPSVGRLNWVPAKT